jgi:two-component system, response regulator
LTASSIILYHLFSYSFNFDQTLAMNKFVAMLEDDSDDRYLTSETLAELNIDVPIHYYSSSQDLLASLSNDPKPSLILLDYNSIPENAKEVLKKIRQDSGLSEIPVVVLSDTDLPAYKNQCYALGASSFIKKPDNLEETQKKIGTFFKYWFEVAEV